MLTKISKNSNSDFDIDPMNLKLEIVQDILILYKCVKFDWNLCKNEAARVLTKIF